METRAYFLFGDLFGNLLVGSLAAVLCGYLFSGWPMLPGMIIAMFLGMIISSILTFAFLLKYFGAMEVMLQVMTTGMFAGMAVVMWPPDTGYSFLGAAQTGLITGLVVFSLCWVINAVIVGKTPSH